MSESPLRSVAGTGGLLRGYGPPAGGHDELVEADGSVRPVWEAVMRSLDGLSPAERAARCDTARRLVRRSGVTYHVYDDPRGATRPWALDPLPLLVAPGEWAALERGLEQRARLLDAVLADCYGPQRLLAGGLLPPELIYGNPAFLRPCHGVAIPRGVRLHVYAADLGRAADGAWHVLGERSQVPSGAGYALANRLVVSSTLPEAVGAVRLRRLARWFADLRDGLRAIAPRERENPRIVVLTPGPLNETWFEHAFLARYLGFPLVEGGDLLVREGGVHLKVLGGLQRVDVILRRLDDDFADPLELRGDSSLGVPGLVHAVREGSVSVANALGSGLVEMPALQPYLPAICRAILGEDLRLPAAPSWWCGRPGGLAQVLDAFESLVLKPAHPALAREPVFVQLLPRAEREALRDEVRARPGAWVGQVALPLATAPVLQGGALVPRRVSLRCLVAATASGFAVMPGGLARVAASGEALVLSMQRGATSKDTWVLSDEPVDDFSLLAPPGEPVGLTRGGRDLPSRVADELFWVGRYAERAGALVRLLRAALVRVAQRSGLGGAPELPALLRAITETTATPPGFVGDGAEERLQRPEPELLSLAFDGGRAGALRATLGRLARSGRTVRDRLPADAGRLLSGLDRALTGPRPERVRRAGDLLVRLDALAVQLAALDGLVLDGTTRGEGWRFLDMGRRIERAAHLVGLLRALLLPPADDETEVPLLEALLEVGDGLLTYRRRYLARVQPHAVLDLLLADPTNPRAVVFQLRALERHVRRLPRERPQVGPSPAERLALEVYTAARLADPTALCGRDAGGLRPALDALLATLASALPRLSDVIAQRWLSHAQLPQPLGEARR